MENTELYVTASLAALELTAEEAGELSKAVEQMLDYFSKMAEFDIKNLEPTTHALLASNRLRPDILNAAINPDDLLERAPELEDRFIVIPNVL
ncbi:MAG: Asp-tRNA(Asn)/Glu-tRNA(Gln) amidotransferase subunit GatC [Spirochaetales bacterium]|nr:MAG: Asp-tRNA(Asn)/Glu-tRNA(Gln) amidotransferase subunit GatC [Spirochaetales bacterium]